MPIRFVKPSPDEEWLRRDLTARGEDGTVVLTLRAIADAQPHDEVEIQVVVQIADAKSLLGQLPSAITVAEGQLRKIRS
jgi:hypothetical protein